MTTDSTYSMNCESSSCPAVPLLLALMDEVRLIQQTLQNEKSRTRKVSKATAGRLHVGRLVFALQVECPEKVWTSDSFAKKIGCTGAAVRKTKEWKECQERIERKKHSRLAKYGDNQGSLDAFNVDEKEKNFRE